MLFFDEKPGLIHLKPEPIALLRRQKIRRLGMVFALVCLAVGLLLLLLRSTESIGGHKLPDFSTYADVSEKKEAFFEFLAPMVQDENARILKIREEILTLQQRLTDGKALRKSQIRRLRELGEQYAFEDLETIDARFVDYLLQRVDVVPVSLALAQAAYESGWGTSRFARQGNNLYGIWCYTPGCGMVPKRRSPGMTHEVASYGTVEECIRDYIHNLNTGNAYRSVRGIRNDLRVHGEPVQGMPLARGLERYSGIGWDYVLEMQDMIRANNLDRYDLN